jgi:phosphoribosylformylglycinamidine (FGAM) synthase-like enzyme
VLAGAALQDIALCDNFYTPHLSDGWAYWLVSMVDELAALVRAFGTPVVSGKDSSAGSVRTRDGVVNVPPAVFLSGLGKVASFGTLLRNDWREPGNLLVHIGPKCRSAAGTAAARILKLDANDVDDLDVQKYLDYLVAIAPSNRAGWASGIPVGPGGLLGLMAERSISSGFGVDLARPPEGLWWLLAEHHCGALIEIDEQSANRLPAGELQPHVVGRIVDTGPSIRLSGIELLTPTAIQSWSSTFRDSLT